jgi:hypothetical protein
VLQNQIVILNSQGVSCPCDRELIGKPYLNCERKQYFAQGIIVYLGYYLLTAGCVNNFLIFAIVPAYFSATIKDWGTSSPFEQKLTQAEDIVSGKKFPDRQFCYQNTCLD